MALLFLYDDLHFIVHESGQEQRKQILVESIIAALKAYLPICITHFSSALDLLKEKQYHAADKRLQVCLDFKNDCLQCRPIIKQCEDSYKELHYQLGIKYFGEEKLENAINEWQLVKKFDPHYKQVEQNIRKAEKISTKIQQLKKEIEN